MICSHQESVSLIHLMVLVERDTRKSLYVEQLRGFKLLANWLAPIAIPTPPADFKYPNLYRSYYIQEIATHLKCSQEQVAYAYEEALQWTFDLNN